MILINFIRKSQTNSRLRKSLGRADARTPSVLAGHLPRLRGGGIGFVVALMLPLSACAQETDEPGLHEEQSETEMQVLEGYESSPIQNDKASQEELEAFLKEYNDIRTKGISCIGIPKPGGLVVCQTEPNAKIKVERTEDDFYYELADSNGVLLVGFDRDEKFASIGDENSTVLYQFNPRDYDTSRIDGLPPSQVSTFTEEQLKRIRSSSARKKAGFSSRATEMGFEDGFIYPVANYTKTTNFGAQRILNGEPKKPHYGVDLAAPIGTPIVAPADGIVSLADDDLYFEGAMVLLDHGQGLISMYLHTDEILVEPGQAVKRGEQIATVGSKGRSTGPHLCWRLKWRNRNLDPELLTEWPDVD